MLGDVKAPGESLLDSAEPRCRRLDVGLGIWLANADLPQAARCLFIRVGAGGVVKIVDLPSNAFGVGLATLFPVQFQCLSPGNAGLVVLSCGGAWMPEVRRCVRDPVYVAASTPQDRGPVVVANGQPVVAGAVGDESEAVQSGSLAAAIAVTLIERESGSAVVTGRVEVVQPCDAPAQLVEQARFSHWPIEGSAEVEGRSQVAGQGATFTVAVREWDDTAAEEVERAKRSMTADGTIRLTGDEVSFHSDGGLTGVGDRRGWMSTPAAASS